MGTISVIVPPPVIMETAGEMPTIEELGKIHEELSGFLRQRLEESGREFEQQRPRNLNFILMGVDIAVIGREELTGRLFTVLMTPFPADAEDEWRALLLAYLRERGFAVREISYGENHALCLVGLEVTSDTDIYGLLRPFLERLQAAGKV
jgi:hypothetical protein